MILRNWKHRLNALDQKIQSCNSEEIMTEMTNERKYFKKQLDALYQK